MLRSFSNFSASGGGGITAGKLSRSITASSVTPICQTPEPIGASGIGLIGRRLARGGRDGRDTWDLALRLRLNLAALAVVAALMDTPAALSLVFSSSLACCRSSLSRSLSCLLSIRVFSFDSRRHLCFQHTFFLTWYRYPRRERNTYHRFIMFRTFKKATGSCMKHSALMR